MNFVNASSPISFTGHWDGKRLSLDVPELNIQAEKYDARELAANLPLEVERALRESPLRLRIARLLPYVGGSARSIGGSEPAIRTTAANSREMGGVIAAWICEKLHRTVGENNLRAAEEYLAEQVALREQNVIWGPIKPQGDGVAPSELSASEPPRMHEETQADHRNWLHEQELEDPDAWLRPIPDIMAGQRRKLEDFRKNRPQGEPEPTAGDLPRLQAQLAEMLEAWPETYAGGGPEVEAWMAEYQSLARKIAILISQLYKLDPSGIDYLNMNTEYALGSGNVAIFRLVMQDMAQEFADLFLGEPMDAESLRGLEDLSRGMVWTPEAQALLAEHHAKLRVIADNPELIGLYLAAAVQDFIDALTGDDIYKQIRASVELFLMALPPLKLRKAKMVDAPDDPPRLPLGKKPDPFALTAENVRQAVAKSKYRKHIGKVIKVDAGELRFSQTTVSYGKYDNHGNLLYTYDDIKNWLYNDGWKKDNIIDVVIMPPDGGLTSVDNTRLRAARELGVDKKGRPIKPWVRVHHPDEALDPGSLERFAKNGRESFPTTWGEAARERVRYQNSVQPGDEYGIEALPRVTYKSK